MSSTGSSDIDRKKYDDAVSFLYGLQKHGIKLGLENTTRLLSLLGNPERSFESAHIAGTNGKGSTSAMIASVLHAAGLCVGLFTSPHLVSFTERIRVDGDEIKEEEVVELTNRVREVVDSRFTVIPTFFEFVTAIAFQYFRIRDINWAIVETGMGGRLDATNVVRPRVSVITNIAYDHREFLGETLEEIAREKAGIIKEGIPVVSAAQDPEAMEVIQRKAAETGSRLFVYGRDFVSVAKRGDRNGTIFDYEGEARMEDLFIPLCGEHQVRNAALALKALELIMEKEASITEGSMREGLARTRWPGRLELVRTDSRGYDLLIDGAHNPAAASALADALRRYFRPSYDRIILILGAMADKDLNGLMAPLLPLADGIIFTAPDYGRAALPSVLAEHAASLGFRNGVVARTVSDAIDQAEQMTSASDRGRSLIVITGSFYTIGEAKTVLGQEGILTRLRE